MYTSPSAAKYASSITLAITTAPFWMLNIYAKNEAENIAPHILRRIKEEIDG
jgi:hypothetical protein